MSFFAHFYTYLLYVPIAANGLQVGEVAVYYQPAIIISKSIYLNQQIYFIINILAIWVQAVLRRNR
jgi:hypothetical protein